MDGDMPVAGVSTGKIIGFQIGAEWTEPPGAVAGDPIR